MISVKTLEWAYDAARLIDQTLLPNDIVYLDVRDIETMWEAIKMLRVRGAPAIGVAAAFGVYLGVRDSSASDYETFKGEVDRAANYLNTSRPTAVNLFWATRRMQNVASQNAHKPVAEIKDALLHEAIYMIEEDAAVCQKIGEYGAALVRDGDHLLTHCNAGALATVGIGTSTGPMYVAHGQGKKFRVFADETRPLLQGARLTAWELQQAGIDVTLITDNMAATVMSQGQVNIIFVGTDRVAANGDVCNKIGTMGVAILAREFGIPFYVCAPTSSIDMTLASGNLIPIEERKPEEVSEGFGRRTAPVGVHIYNPAFDVTPNKYITGLITEKGIVYPPFDVGLKNLLG